MGVHLRPYKVFSVAILIRAPSPILERNPEPSRSYMAQTRAEAIAAERLDRTRSVAVRIIEETFEDLKVHATDSINELLVECTANFEWAVMKGHSSDHFHRAVQGFRHLQLCLNSLGYLAPTAAEALDHIWFELSVDGCVGHAAFFKDCGLEASFIDCMHVVNDTIAISMIRDRTLQQVMEMEGIDHDTKSKLRHSYFIMKRFLRDVGQHLLEFAAELPSDRSADWAARSRRR
jgi:hypothetical protein